MCQASPWQAHASVRHVQRLPPTCESDERSVARAHLGCPPSLLASCQVPAPGRVALKLAQLAQGVQGAGGGEVFGGGGAWRHARPLLACASGRGAAICRARGPEAQSNLARVRLGQAAAVIAPPLPMQRSSQGPEPCASHVQRAQRLQGRELGSASGNRSRLSHVRGRGPACSKITFGVLIHTLMSSSRDGVHPRLSPRRALLQSQGISKLGEKHI